MYIISYNDVDRLRFGLAYRPVVLITLLLNDTLINTCPRALLNGFLNIFDVVYKETFSAQHAIEERKT